MTLVVGRRWPAGLRALGPTVIAASILTILSWPVLGTAARTGLDPSWQIALHMAAAAGLQYGSDFIMTYGPLGFLGYPAPIVGWTSGLALVATLAVYGAVISTLLIRARRIFPFWAAVLVTLALGRLLTFLPMWETFQVLVFLWGVEAIGGRIPLGGRTIVVVAGILAGVAALGKLNVGTFVIVMGAVVVLTAGPRWWRALLGYGGTALATALVLWFATGQHLANIDGFVRTAYQVISGYSEAMQTDRDPALHTYYAVFAAVAIIVGVLAWQASRDWARPRQLALAALLALLLFAEWKTAFTREYPPYAFVTLTIASSAFAEPRLRSRALALALSVLFLVGAASAHLLPTPAAALSPRAVLSYLDAPASARSLLGTAFDVIVPGRLGVAVERTRMELRTLYGLEPDILAAIDGRTVHVDPWETAVVFAYPGLAWDPLPVFQSYAAWTSTLDGIDAAYLSGPAAPDRILRSVAYWPPMPSWVVRQLGRRLLPGERVPGEVDGRYRWFEAPAATLQAFCRYRQIVANDRWQVLGRTGGRCAQPEPLATVTSAAGRTVAVPVDPRPDRFVIVRIHGLEPGPLDRLVSALHKGHQWFVTVGDLRYRLIAGTAADGLLLAVPPAADGTGNFAFGPAIATLRVDSDAGPGTGQPITYEFLSVPWTP